MDIPERTNWRQMLLPWLLSERLAGTNWLASAYWSNLLNAPRCRALPYLGIISPLIRRSQSESPICGPKTDDSHFMKKASLIEKFALIHEHWRPKVIAELNGQEVKLVKFAGVFPWHQHEHEDEMFLVWRGQMTIEFRDQTVLLNPGEFCVVSRGVEHRTSAETEAE